MSKARRITPSLLAAAQVPDPDAAADASPVMATAPRSRRALIQAGLAGVAGLALGSLSAPEAADAAAGGNMLLGRANSAGTAGTSLTTKSTAAGLTVAQTGTGPGVRASAKAGPAAIVSSTAGNGLTATTAAANRQAIRANNAAAGAGTAIRATAAGAVDADFASTGRAAAAGEFASSGTAIVAMGGDTGVYGRSPAGSGVSASTVSGSAVYAEATGTGTGVYAYSENGTGLTAYSGIGGGSALIAYGSAGNAVTAHAVGGIGVDITSQVGDPAVRGLSGAAASVVTDMYSLVGGIYPAAGEFAGSGGGVIAVAGSGRIGALGVAPDDGIGVAGKSGSGNGVYARSESGMAVYASSGTSTAVRAAGGSVGLDASASTGTGVVGAGTDYGVVGTVNTAGAGVRGMSMFGTGVEAESDGSAGAALTANNTGTGWGLIAYSKSQVQSSLDVTGTLTKGGGTFRIDHPLDPAHKFLSHSFVESPDMKNVYDGVVELDAHGEATVTLPDWFEALNRDVRYQLTAVGAAMPSLHVAREFKGGTFAIGGGLPGKKVSWMLTGIRKDAWAEAHRTPVEEDKTGEDLGRYLHPEEHGKSSNHGIGFAMRERMVAARPKG